MKATGWLVLQKRAGYAKIARTTMGRPWLNHDEARIKVTLEIPDDLFDNPAVTVPVDRYQVEVAVALAELEETT